jgi:hypothetical protein
MECIYNHPVDYFIAKYLQASTLPPVSFGTQTDLSTHNKWNTIYIYRYLPYKGYRLNY